ncbi:keratin-associated protein 15-1-like [Phoca vitulina]|uniref:keratin-associated protein 15-1-like n=1 Tax=Phoca vitulina TaxID=9720 RepID=UPI00139629C9|nr:keratin-associated protein 15-1-like [Phoca vitulina]
MHYNRCPGNFSSCSLGGYLGYPGSPYDSFYPSNEIYSPSTYQLGSSVFDGYQETCYEPISCGTSSAGARPYQTSCFHPKNSFFFSPCQTNYMGSLGFGNIGLGPFGYGSTGFQSLGCGSSFSRPTYFSSRSCQSTCYQPAFSSRFFRSTC